MFGQPGQIKVDPVKWQTVDVGNVRAGAVANTGTVRLRLTSPSRRIHWTVQAGWSGTPVMTSATWSLWPVMIDPVHGGRATRLQPVVSAQALPDGYEAESGVVEWEIEMSFAPFTSDAARLMCIAKWEPSVLGMSAEERAYWFGQCALQLITSPVDLSAAP